MDHVGRDDVRRGRAGVGDLGGVEGLGSVDRDGATHTARHGREVGARVRDTGDAWQHAPRVTAQVWLPPQGHGASRYIYTH